MAEAAMSFAVEKLSNLVIEKVDFLRGVDQQVKWLKDELETMQCFLKDAAKTQNNFETIRKQIKDIREVAHDAEDVIEAFILQVETPRRSRGLLERCAYFPNHLYNLDTIGQQIESIRSQLKQIKERLPIYQSENLYLRGPKVSSGRSDTSERRKLSPWQRDKHLVGVDEDVESLLQKAILEEKKGLSIASIVGMGGIGKSTLARAVYNHPKVGHQFDCRAWVVVSEQFNLTETIKELVLQLLGSNENEQEVLQIMKDSPEQHLKSMLHERLKGKQYFIVVDDVWRQQDWESLASTFPDEKGKASRLLVTSRNQSIPGSAQYAHKMKTLDPDKSWELLLKTAFNDITNIRKCPRELEDIGREILGKCNGLPLAIIMVGGLLLKQRESKSGWQKVLKGINSHLGRSESNSVQAILELSYQDLPSHLKSCFLCLAFFREDATILAEKLINIWIAEGLVPLEEEETMEDKARGYLEELINRNMVKVKDLSNKDDRIKSCQIHDLLRELSIIKAKEEINFEIIKDHENISQSLDHKSRHCVIYSSNSDRAFNISSNRHIRSLFFYGNRYDFSLSRILSHNWKCYKLLRVLELEDLGLRELPSTIGALIGLRYLGLRNNDIDRLPKWLGCLKNLQVLDMGDVVVVVPNVIWKMDSLRHIYIYGILCKLPLKVDTLKNLQTLKYIPVSSWILVHPKRMTSLRKLGIQLEENTDVRELYTSLAMLENLVCLSLRKQFGPMPSLDRLVLLRHLTQFKFMGKLRELPNANDFPPNLSSLTLKHTRLDEDPILVLEKLPKLLYLKLNDAYNGEEMEISCDGFPSLKVFRLNDFSKLRSIKVGKGGMSELKRLEISDCLGLERLPEEVRFMTNLQELKIETTPGIAFTFRDVNSYTISNISSVIIVGRYKMENTENE